MAKEEAAPKFEDTEPVHEDSAPPPHYDDTHPVEEDVPSMDYGHGILNQILGGVPGGLRDAVQAAVGTAAYRSALPDNSPDNLSLLDRYYDTKKDIQRQHEKFEHSNPKASTVAQLAGGLATPIGAIGSAAKGAKAVQAAKTGALLGALYGFGASTGQIAGSDANPSLLAKDTIENAAGGAVLGPLVEAMPPAVRTGIGLGAGAAATYSGMSGDNDSFKTVLPLAMLSGGALAGVRSGVRNAIDKSDSPMIQQLKKAYTLENSGQRLYGVKAKEDLENEINDTSKDLLSDLLKGKNVGSQKVGKVLQDNSQNLVDIKPTLDKYYKQALEMPASTPEEIEDKKKVLTTLENMLFGSETQKVESVIPGEHIVKPGKTVESGEDTVMGRLQDQLAKISAKQQANIPENQAKQKLADQFSKQELSSEKPSTKKFSPDDIEPITTSADQSALTTMGPEGDKLAALIKGAGKPGEIQTFTDPSTGKKVMGFIDENGKLVAHVVPDQAAYTPVSITKSPDKTVMSTERVGGQTMVSPQDVQNKMMSVRNLSRIGERPVNTADASNLVRDAQGELTGDLNNALSPEDQDALKAGNFQMNKFSNAQEMMGVKPNGPLTEPDRMALENKIGSFIRGLGQESSTAEARRNTIDNMVDQLKDVAPDLAHFMQNNVGELADKYDLNKQMNRTGIGHSEMNLLGTLKGMNLKGAAAMGRGMRAVDQAVANMGDKAGELGFKAGKTLSPYKNNASEMAGSTSAFISKATPETIKALIPKVAAPYQKTLAQIADVNVAEATRRAVLFSLMQQPAFRESVGNLVGTVGTIINSDESR